MNGIDNSTLSPVALARIEQMREKARCIVAQGQIDAAQIAGGWLDSRIECDREDRAFACSEAKSLIMASQAAAWDLYFGAMAYEHFLISPSPVVFEPLVELLDTHASLDFPCASDLRQIRKPLWVARAFGREKIQNATFGRCPPAFWKERASEFAKLDGADLWAEISDWGWWNINGGPGNPTAKAVLHDELGRIVRRAVSALGISDRSVAEAIWMDAVHRASSYTVPYGVSQLCFAYTDFCIGLAELTIPSEAGSSPKSGGPVAEESQIGSSKDWAGTADVRGRPFFAKVGELWSICFDATTINLRDAKGLSYIAHLLRSPGTLCLAADLVAGTTGTTDLIPIGSAGEILDSTATDRYRARAEDLRGQLAEAERNNDQGRKELIHRELDQLTDQVLAAKGFGGRARQSQDDREKFRKSVSMAISRSIGNIRKKDPALAEHLHRYIDLGHFVVYSGDLDWEF